MKGKKKRERDKKEKEKKEKNFMDYIAVCFFVSVSLLDYDFQDCYLENKYRENSIESTHYNFSLLSKMEVKYI